MSEPHAANKLETLQVEDRQSWREWLKRNHDISPGVWLIIHKKGSCPKGVDIDDAVEEALCFGWISSKPNVLDHEGYKLMLTPRRPGSVWPRPNKLRVGRLMKQGLIVRAGLEKIEAARRDGSWSSLDSIEESIIPEDFKNALVADLEAKLNFEAFSKTAKKQILWWIKSAKTPETRLKRIEKAVSMAARNKKGKSSLQSAQSLI
jgi:uncharacterized protein YdeI (YjbR/CyaY-like superfamily)